MRTGQNIDNVYMTVGWANLRWTLWLRDTKRVRVWSVFEQLQYWVRAGIHEDVLTWKHVPFYWPFARGIHRSTTINTEPWFFFLCQPEQAVVCDIYLRTITDHALAIDHYIKLKIIKLEIQFSWDCIWNGSICFRQEWIHCYQRRSDNQ